MNKRLVLSFHGVGQPHSWSDQAELHHWCSEADFLSIIDAIPQVSAEMLIPIEITFDDGFDSDFKIAAPALQKRGLAAAFFVCAGRIGKTGYLDAYQLRELAHSGMTIGSHGWDHVDWRRTYEKNAFDREIVQARRFIEDTLSAGPIESVAIPFGSYDRRVMNAVAQTFSVAYTSDDGLAQVSAATVPRETYKAHQWEANTLRTMAGARPFMSSLRQRLAMAYKRRRGSPR